MAAARPLPLEKTHSWRVLWELALKQCAQQVSHRHALREGRDIDAGAQRGRDVERQTCGVEVTFLKVGAVALTNPRLGVRIFRRARTEEHRVGKECVSTGRSRW